MTRKDYELIASVIRKFPRDNDFCIEVGDFVLALSKALEAENPRFDRLTFLMASGISDTTYFYKLNSEICAANRSAI